MVHPGLHSQGRLHQHRTPRQLLHQHCALWPQRHLCHETKSNTKRPHHEDLCNSLRAPLSISVRLSNGSQIINKLNLVTPTPESAGVGACPAGECQSSALYCCKSTLYLGESTRFSRESCPRIRSMKDPEGKFPCWDGSTDSRRLELGSVFLTSLPPALEHPEREGLKY